MRIKGANQEDFVNYKLPSMYLATSFCTFKCEKECGIECCQNSSLADPSMIPIEVSDDSIIERYIKNPITKSIVFGGLEPLDQFDELMEFIDRLRNHYKVMDDVVIYTGYKYEEIADKVEKIKVFKNIVVKYGRFVPNQEKHYDEVLGVQLASPNQYAERYD